MVKNITTYNELLEEKKRLEALLATQKQILRADVQEIKAIFQPVRDAVDVVKKFTTRDKSNLLVTLGTDTLVNMLIKNFLLKKTGWITKLVIPFLLKNYTSHVVNDNKAKWFQKLTSLFGRKNGRHKEEEHIDTEEKY